MGLTHILKELSAAADPRVAAVSCRFFKSGPGEYGEGDLFLRTHGRRMPRTTLRYAIERLPEEKRRHYLRGAI
jgi:hypothetical protein